jgi:hypothetical protein
VRDDGVTLSLPDGRTVRLSRGQARRVTDKLWALGLTPGAAMSAAKLSDALTHADTALRPVVFEARELGPLQRALESELAEGTARGLAGSA